MTDQDLLIELEPDDTQGHTKLRVTDEDGWLTDRAGRDPGSRITLQPIDDDVQGHEVSSTVTLRAFGDDDDTEGHAISVHFPTVEEADAFRRRLMVAGVLAGSIAVGAVAGIGIANLPSDDAASAAAAGTLPGMEWSQADERPDAAAAAGTSAGSDWTQMERPITGAGISSGVTSEYDWTDMERPRTAPGAPEAPDIESDTKGPAPR